MTLDPAPRRRLSPEQRRAEIVAAGAAVFADRGYQGTSLEDIAASAGVTRPLLYHYFRDKDELYREILRAARAELDEALAAAVAAADAPAERLRAGLTAYLTFVRDRGRQWDLLFGGGTAVAGELAEESARLRFATADKIAALVRQGAPELDPQAAGAYAHAVSGAGEQLAKWWRAHPSVALDVVVGYLLDVVWSGLAQVADRPDVDG